MVESCLGGSLAAASTASSMVTVRPAVIPLVVGIANGPLRGLPLVNMMNNYLIGKKRAPATGIPLV